MELKPTEYMNLQWDKINRARWEFQKFINYEWNYAVHISFHKNNETVTETTNKLVRSYLNDLRRLRKLTFSAFYIIPRSYVDPDFNPHHIHILLLIYNTQDRMKILLKDATTKYNAINKSEVHELYNPEAGTMYLTKFKNLKLTDPENIYFDFYREKLLKKYGNPTGYINDELRLAFERKRS